MKTNNVIHHIAQVLSIALAFIWLGWKAGVVIYLVNWAANTHPRPKGRI